MMVIETSVLQYWDVSKLWKGEWYGRHVKYSSNHHIYISRITRQAAAFKIAFYYQKVRQF
jgi:hypothetical protein